MKNTTKRTITIVSIATALCITAIVGCTVVHNNSTEPSGIVAEAEVITPDVNDDVEVTAEPTVETTVEVEETTEVADETPVTTESTDEDTDESAPTTETTETKDEDEKPAPEPPVEEEDEDPAPKPEPKPEPHTHSYTSAVTTQPTCTSEGTRTYTCECGHSYTESIAKSDHCWHTTTETKTIHHDAEYTTEWHLVADDGFDFTAAGYSEQQIIDYCYEHECGYGDRAVQVLVREAWDETVTTEVTTCSNCGASK